MGHYHFLGEYKCDDQCVCIVLNIVKLYFLSFYITAFDLIECLRKIKRKILKSFWSKTIIDICGVVYHFIKNTKIKIKLFLIIMI